MRLDKAIGRLSSSRHSNNIGIVVEQEFVNLCTEKFVVTIGPETPGEQAHVHMEEPKCGKDGIAR